MKTLFTLSLWLLLFTSCQTVKMASYDNYSHQRTIVLKTATNDMIVRSDQPFATYSQQADSLLMSLHLQYEYETNRPDNAITSAMWFKLIGNKESLLPRFVTHWKQKEKLNPSFTEESSRQMSQLFDQIITLETTKEK